MRRTRIVATLGPACDRDDTLAEMLYAGMDCARLTVSHDPLDVALERFRRVRRVAAEIGRPVATLLDLPGPKIRTGPFSAGTRLATGTMVELVTGSGPAGAEVIPVGYDALVDEVGPGDRLVFGDGLVVVEVTARSAAGLAARVLNGGAMSGRPGVHIAADGVSLSAPTDEDLALARAFTAAGVDAIAVSFLRQASDIDRLELATHPRGPLVVAKVETSGAVRNLDSIIGRAGAIMVARGDLGVALPMEDVPHVQKNLIRRCLGLGRPVITATQLLESMVTAPSPTRAEASDVANAVLDGSSALMLSGETAVGHDPVGAVAAMARLAARADIELDPSTWQVPARRRSDIPGADHGDDSLTDQMTSIACTMAQTLDASAIVCGSRSGFTARALARFRVRQQIVALCTNEVVARQLQLSWGVTTLAVHPQDDPVTIIRVNAEALGLPAGRPVVVLTGSTHHEGRISDTLQVVEL
jgi:pyruvate kinase